MPIIYKGINDLTYRQVKSGDRIAVNGNECVDLNTLTNPEITSELGYDDAKVISQAGFTNTVNKLKGDYVIEVTHPELLELMESSSLDTSAKYVLKDFQSVYRSANRWASNYEFDSNSEYVLANPMGWLGTSDLVGWDGVARPSDFYDLLLTPVSSSKIDVKVKIIAVRDQDGNTPAYAWDHLVWEAHYNPYNKGTSIEAQRMFGDFRTYRIAAPTNAAFMKRSIDTANGVNLDDVKIYKEFQPENNLFDKTTITTGAYINNKGESVSNGTFIITDFIPVVPGGNYITTGYLNLGSSPAVCFYDKDKNFISGQNNGFSRSAWLPEIYTTTGTITRLKNPRLNWDFPYDMFNCQWVKKKTDIMWMFSNLNNILLGSATGFGWANADSFIKSGKDYVFNMSLVANEDKSLKSNSFKLIASSNYKLKFSTEFSEIITNGGEVYISDVENGDKMFSEALSWDSTSKEFNFSFNSGTVDTDKSYYLFIKFNSQVDGDLKVKNVQLVQTDEELIRFNLNYSDSGQSQYFYTFNRGVLSDMSYNTVREDFIKNSINNVIFGKASTNYYGGPDIWNYCSEDVLKDPAGYFEAPSFNMGEDNSEYGHYNNQGNVFMQLFEDIESGGRGYSDIYFEPYSYDNLVVARWDNRVLGFFYGQLARQNKVKVYFISRLSIGHHATDNIVEGDMWSEPSLFQSIRIKEWCSSCHLKAISMSTVDVDGYKVVAHAKNTISRLNVVQGYDINISSGTDLYRFNSSQGVFLNIVAPAGIQRLIMDQCYEVDVISKSGTIGETKMEQVVNSNFNFATNFQRSNFVNVSNSNFTTIDDEFADISANSVVFTNIEAKGEIRNLQIQSTGYDLGSDSQPVVKTVKAIEGDIRNVTLNGKLAPSIMSSVSILDSVILSSPNNSIETVPGNSIESVSLFNGIDLSN